VFPRFQGGAEEPRGDRGLAGEASTTGTASAGWGNLRLGTEPALRAANLSAFPIPPNGWVAGGATWQTRHAVPPHGDRVCQPATSSQRARSPSGCFWRNRQIAGRDDPARRLRNRPATPQRPLVSPGPSGPEFCGSGMIAERIPWRRRGRTRFPTCSVSLIQGFAPRRGPWAVPRWGCSAKRTD
jgi:hypothetical protein